MGDHQQPLLPRVGGQDPTQLGQLLAFGCQPLSTETGEAQSEGRHLARLLELVHLLLVLLLHLCPGHLRRLTH